MSLRGAFWFALSTQRAMRRKPGSFMCLSSSLLLTCFAFFVTYRSGSLAMYAFLFLSYCRPPGNPSFSTVNSEMLLKNDAKNMWANKDRNVAKNAHARARAHTHTYTQHNTTQEHIPYIVHPLVHSFIQSFAGSFIHFTQLFMLNHSSLNYSQLFTPNYSYSYDVASIQTVECSKASQAYPERHLQQVVGWVWSLQLAAKKGPILHPETLKSSTNQPKKAPTNNSTRQFPKWRQYFNATALTKIPKKKRRLVMMRGNSQKGVSISMQLPSPHFSPRPHDRAPMLSAHHPLGSIS
jgi:hypothetical protein